MGAGGERPVIARSNRGAFSGLTHKCRGGIWASPPLEYAMPAREADRYRQHAEEVERMARQISFAPDRDQLLKIAAEWRRLEAEALKRAGLPPPTKS